MNTSDSQLPEFGVKRDSEERRDGGCAVIFYPITYLYAVGKHLDGGFLRLFSGGVAENEDIVEGIKREVIEESGLYDFQRIENIGSAFAHYHNTLRKVNRVAKTSCLLIIVNSIDCVPVKHEDHEKFTLDWVSEEKLRNNWKKHNQEQELDHWFYFLDKASQRIREMGYIEK